jgi:hypothetical protein
MEYHFYAARKQSAIIILSYKFAINRYGNVEGCITDIWVGK